MISIAIATLDTGAYRVQRFEGAVAIGRDDRCDLVLSARGVSGSHCRLSPMPGLQGAFMLEDLGSTYGTFVNDGRVGKPVVVSGRDVITVGGHRLVLADVGQENAAVERLRALVAPPEPVAPAAPPPAVVAGALAAFDPTAPWMQQFEYFDGLARAWHEAGRPRSRLLQGPAIAVARQWLAAGARQSPTPDALHRDFIERSGRRRSARVQGIVLVGTVVGLGVAGGVGWKVFGTELEGVLETPTVVTASDPVEDEVPAQVAAVDLPSLIDATVAAPEPTTRLLLQASVARVARAQGVGLLSDAAWSLQTSAQGTLAERGETVLTGHTAPVNAVAFDPQGSWVASASEDGSARLWDFAAPIPGRAFTLRGHIGPVTALAFHPQGRWLVTAGDDGKLWRWDVGANDPGGTGLALKRHDSAVRHLAWHPGGRFLVSGDDTGMLVAWDLESPEFTATSRAAHEGPITDLVFGAGAEPQLLSASDDRMARRWKIREDGTLARQRTFDIHTGGVTSVAVATNGRWLATATTAGEVYLWPQAQPKAGRGGKRKGPGAAPPIPLLGHTAAVNQLVFTPQGRWLVSAGDDGTLRMWDLSAKDASVTSIVLTGHTGDVSALALAGGGSHVVSAGSDNSLRVWDLDKAQQVIDQIELAGHTGPVGVVATSSDGLRVVSGADDGTVRVWDAFGRSPGRGGRVLRASATPVQDFDVTDTGRLVAVTEDRVALWNLTERGRWLRTSTLSGAQGLLYATAFDPQGRFVAAASDSGTISVWPLAGTAGGERRVLDGHTGPVNALGFAPDGRLLSVSSDRTVRVWDLDSAEGGAAWTGHPDEVHVLAIGPRGKYAFSGGLDGSIVRWSLTDGTATNLAGHEGEILQLRVSEDGNTLASASADRNVRLWDVETGRTAHVLRRHDEPVKAVAFGRNGLLASGGEDHDILLWNLKSQYPEEAPRVLRGHEQSVTDLAFIGDGNVLASSSNDHTVRLWRVDTDRSLILRGHDQVVTKLRVTPDSEALVSASFDGTVRLWPLGVEGFERLICGVVGHGLQPGETEATLGSATPLPCITKP